MGLISWARERLGLTEGARWAALYGGGANWAGRPVTVNSSLTSSTYFRAVKLYAEVVGAMSLKFYERIGEDEDRKQRRDHAVAELIALEPNIDQTALEFWACQAASLCMFGNAFAEKQFIGDRLVALQPLPYDTQPYRDENNDLYFRFSYGGKKDNLPREKVFHTKGWTFFGNDFSHSGDLGVSPLAHARQTLSTALATEEAAGKTFSQGLRLSGFFTGPLSTPEQRKQFKETYIDKITGNDASAHYGILPPQFDFKTINIPPKDAEMLLSRRHNNEEIARFMGVPPILLGIVAEGQTMWGSGVENIVNQWYVLGLDSFLRNIEQSINKRLMKLADRRKFYAEFDRESLKRIDSAARSALISNLIQNGQLTPNEGRRMQNRMPVDGGDIALVNSTLVPLTQVGQKPARIQPAPGEPIPEPTS